MHREIPLKLHSLDLVDDIVDPFQLSSVTMDYITTQKTDFIEVETAKGDKDEKGEDKVEIAIDFYLA